MREITISGRQPDADYSILKARVTEAGKLMLDGYDVGEYGPRLWGRNDCE